MKKIGNHSYILILLSLLFLNPSLFSQRVIEVKYEQDRQGNYNFSCTNKAYCNYILEINFTTLDNAKPDHVLPYRAVVTPGSNKLFKLSKENANNPVQFKYKISYFKGCLNPQVNTDFTYLLPITPGKEAQAYELQNIAKPIAPDPSAARGLPQATPGPESWYSIRLKMKPGDTLYAARRGMVTEMDVSSNLNDSGVASAGTENYIEIVHGDCSFGHYGILRKNSSFVRPGQFVEAGEPIGLVGGDKYGRGSEVRFSVSYNPGQDGSWAYVPLKFWTKKNGKGMLKHGGTYISEFPESIITREMSKAELKKWKAGRKTK